MSTEYAAILFTDVVGSTELSQRLAPDVADEVRRGHFSILRQALAEAGGIEVKNLGDGLMVVFGSASAALACAVAMQQGVERDNRDRKHSVGLRVGLSGGEVSREDNDYFGDPVVEAARLCSACESGQVLAADVVRAVAGRRSRHECRSLGPLTLKGLTDPVATVEVLWEPLGGADTGTCIPLPSRLAVRPAVGVVGREAEIQALTDATKRVAGGDGREVLLVSGEAGLGKTTLLAEAARTAFEAGAFVLFGHCEEELATPYQLFAEALGHYVTYAPEDQLVAHIATYGSELSMLVPALASRIPGLPPSKATDTDTERYLLFAAVLGLLATVSEQQTVILILDDLQWADKGSLLLLRHVIAAEPAMRVLVLGSYRDSELSRSHPLLDALAALRRLNGVNRIELGGLDDRGVVAFLEAAAGQTLDEAAVGLAHAVYRETDGNPFFVSEVLRHLSETGAIYQDASGRWTGDTTLDQVALPDSIREVIGARVGRLGQDAERVLSMASVIGRDFDLNVLARATKTTEDDLLDILESASAVAPVREPTDASGRYNFAHALIQHTLYEALGPNRRARAHRQVAEALEYLCRDRPGNRVGELARHWIAATQPIEVTKAIDYSRQAGDAALAALAPADALRYYAQAIDLYPQATDPDPALGTDLAIGLGTAQRQVGDPAFRVTLLAAARRAADLGDTDRLVTAALANNRGLFSSLGVVDSEKVTVLETVLGAMPLDDSNERALLLATLCNELTYGRSLVERQALANAAKDMARRLADPATIVRVLNLVEQPLEAPPTLNERIADTTEALTLAEALGDSLPLYFAAVYRRISAIQSGDLGHASTCLDLMRSISERLRQPILMWVTAFHEAAQALVIGDCERAEELATEALQIGTDSGQPDAASFYGSQMVIVRHQQGRLGEFLPVITGVAAEMSDMPVYMGAVAAAHLEAGERNAAFSLLESAAVDGFASMPMVLGWLDGITGYAEVAIELRATKPAALLLELLAPYHGQAGFNGLMPLEPVAHYLGGFASVLGRFEQAEAYFVESTKLNTRGLRKFAQARTDFAWARMLIARGESGDLDRARELLTQVRATAATHGYAGVERRALAVLSTFT